MTEPEENDAREQAVRRLKAKRSFKGLLASAAGVMVIMVLIWALSGQGYFWPIWVVFGLGIALIANGWAAYGPRQGPISEEEVQREMDRQ